MITMCVSVNQSVRGTEWSNFVKVVMLLLNIDADVMIHTVPGAASWREMCGNCNKKLVKTKKNTFNPDLKHFTCINLLQRNTLWVIIPCYE